MKALLAARDIGIGQKSVCGVYATLGKLFSSKRTLERPDFLAVLAAIFAETFVNILGLKAVFAEEAFYGHDATHILGIKATQTFFKCKLSLAIIEKVNFTRGLAAAPRFVGALGVTDGKFSSRHVLADCLALNTELGN